MAEPAAWAAESVIDHAIEILDGVIRNAAIVEFQGRESEYPHR